MTIVEKNMITNHNEIQIFFSLVAAIWTRNILGVYFKISKDRQSYVNYLCKHKTLGRFFAC